MLGGCTDTAVVAENVDRLGECTDTAAAVVAENMDRMGECTDTVVVAENVDRLGECTDIAVLRRMLSGWEGLLSNNKGGCTDSVVAF